MVLRGFAMLNVLLAAAFLFALPAAAQLAATNVAVADTSKDCTVLTTVVPCEQESPNERGAIWLNGFYNDPRQTSNYTAKCYNRDLLCSETTASYYLNPGCPCPPPLTQLNTACDDAASPQYVVCGTSKKDEGECGPIFTNAGCAPGNVPAVYGDGIDTNTWTFKCQAQDSSVTCENTEIDNFYRQRCGCPNGLDAVFLSSCDYQGEELLACVKSLSVIKCEPFFSQASCQDGPPGVFGDGPDPNSWRIKCAAADQAVTCANTAVQSFYTSECGCPEGLQEVPSQGCEDDGIKLVLCSRVNSNTCAATFSQVSCASSMPAVFGNGPDENSWALKCPVSDSSSTCETTVATSMYPVECGCPTGTVPIPTTECNYNGADLVLCGRRAPPAPGPPGVGATLTGDPHLVNMVGSEWEFQGLAGAAFNLFSARHLQINMRLDNFGHDATTTFMQALGVKLGSSVTLEVSADEACREERHLPSVLFNSQRMAPGESRRMSTRLGKVAVDYITAESSTGGVTSTIKASLPFVQLTIIKAEGACHLDMQMNILKVEDPEEVEGVLGQSLRCAMNRNMVQPCTFRGDEMSYIVSGLMEDDFVFNKFDPKNSRAPISGRGQPRVLREVEEEGNVVQMTLANLRRLTAHITLR